MKPLRLDFEDKLRTITKRAKNSQLKRLYDLEKSEVRLMESLSFFETNHNRINGISKIEIATQAGFPNPSSVESALQRLREKNMIVVVPRVHKSIHRTKLYSIPVFNESNIHEPTEFIKVSGRNYKNPPHYALRLESDRGDLGKAGTLLIVHKCTYAPKNTIVVEVGRDTKVYQTKEDHRLLGLFDGYIVSTITPLNLDSYD